MYKKPGRLGTHSGSEVGIVLGVAILITILGTPGTRIGELAAFQRAAVFIALSAAVTEMASLLLARRRRSRHGAAGSQRAEGAGLATHGR